MVSSASSPGFVHPLERLRAVSRRRQQLWVVAYVNQEGNSPLEEQALADVETSLAGGADAVVLINEWCSFAELDRALKAVRARYPRAPLGVNYLGDDDPRSGTGNTDPYGVRGSFELAAKYDLQLVWTDFAGVDLIEEKPEISPHAIDAARRLAPGAFYCSGIHMKYSTLKDPSKPIELSALQALGWVDGVICTGPKTGVPTDPEKLGRVRRVIGDYPLGVASGTSPENAHTIRELIDFCLVASSLQDERKRIVESRVRKLREALGEA
jgi:hypothetical protein